MTYRGKAEKFLKGIGLGERIIIEKGDWSIEGILMPRSELGDEEHIVVKLDNGYNIGIAVEGASVKRSMR